MRMPRLRESTWERGDGRWTLVLVRLTLFFFGTRKEFHVLRVVIRVETSSTFEEGEMNFFIVIGTYSLLHFYKRTWWWYVPRIDLNCLLISGSYTESLHLNDFSNESHHIHRMPH
jgi:hypothetical protein